MLCTMCRRWERVQGASSNGDAWVGGLLPGVVVDDWGEFNFILVRVRGLGGRQRMLVRGGNYASRAQLVEALTRQVGPRRGWRVARRGGGAVYGDGEGQAGCSDWVWLARDTPHGPHHWAWADSTPPVSLSASTSVPFLTLWCAAVYSAPSFPVCADDAALRRAGRAA
jgi:hypothetical protein